MSQVPQPADKALALALLKSIRSMRHACTSAELALLSWMQAQGYLPEKDRGEKHG